MNPFPRTRVDLWSLAVWALAFAIRVVVRFLLDPHLIWQTGYLVYWRAAQSIASGHGYVLPTMYGDKLAHWPPLYPLFLCAVTFGREHSLPFTLACSAVGACTALLAGKIGGLLFGRHAGIVAGMATALYPYFVVHDVRIQETALFTMFIALSAYLLLRLEREQAARLGLLAGLALAAAVLTRATALPFGLLAILWLGLYRNRFAVLLAVTFAISLAPWLIRNQFALGRPILTSQSGRFLWIAHNPYTFSGYPRESIDVSEMNAWENLPVDKQARLLSLGEIAQSDEFQHMGIEYMRARPAEVLTGGLQKLAAGFGPRLSPADGSSWKNLIFTGSYLSALLAAAAGLIAFHRRWREWILIFLVFVNFAGVTFAYWAHSSHRAHLDVYLIIFAAQTTVTAWQRMRKFSKAIGHR